MSKREGVEDGSAGSTQAGFVKGQTSLAQGTKALPVLLGLNKNRMYLLQFRIRVSLFICSLGHHSD